MSTSPEARITLFGATGYTGRIAARLLAESGRQFQLAGRSRDKLRALQIELGGAPTVLTADALADEQLDGLLDQTDVLVSFVGPYNFYGHPLLRKAAAREIYWFDVTGEQEFVRRSFAEFGGSKAETAATIIHSTAFESCLADLLAAEICDGDTAYRDISSYYQLPAAGASPGTRLTMKLARHFPHYRYENGTLRECAPLSNWRSISSPLLESEMQASFMPYPEVLFFSRRYRTENAGSYLLVPPGTGDLSALHAGGNSTQSIEEAVAAFHSRSYNGPSEQKRRAQEFTLLVRAETKGGSVRSARLSGADMYGLTAAIAVHCALNAAEQLRERPESRRRGVLTPAEFLRGSDILAKLGAEYNLALNYTAA